MRLFVPATIVLCCALAAGCTGSRTHQLLESVPVAASDDQIAGRHDIFVATTRGKATEDPRQVFTGARSLTANYARVEVTVPKVHETGRIERKKGAARADPARHFAATGVTDYAGQEDFARAVGQDISRRGDRVLVFVHGYNTGFDDGIFRITQIRHDTRYPGTPVLFSWASGAKTVDYVYDRDSANVARDDLEATLKLIARTNASSIDIIAHSMGTWLTMEVLRQLAIAGDRDLGGKLGYVVLASPDIDVDVFKKQMLRYGKPDRPFAILQSADDRALKLSGIISGDKPRLGDYDDAEDLAAYGVTVFDLTKTASGDRLNHAKFADNPMLVTLLGDRLRAPASLSVDEVSANRQIEAVGKDLGRMAGSMAEIVVTTPFRVFVLGTGG